jgi:hypothetical protein
VPPNRWQLGIEHEPAPYLAPAMFAAAARMAEEWRASMEAFAAATAMSTEQVARSMAELAAWASEAPPPAELPTRQAALDYRRSRGTGPPRGRLDGRRARRSPQVR